MKAGTCPLAVEAVGLSQDGGSQLKNQKMTVSIIVPIYNVEPYLKKCIDSILCQSYRNIQIILVDDGSTDASGCICDEYQSHDARVSVIHKPNGGLVSARKAGLKEAEGDYVLNVDADDWIEPGMVEKLLASAQESQADIVCSAHFLDMGNSSKKIRNRLEQGVYETEDLRTKLLYNGTFYQINITAFIWSKLFKRSILEEVQFSVNEQISFGEDVVVTFPAILHAHKVCIIDYAGYHYVQRAGSITNINYGNEVQRDRALVQYLYKVFAGQKDAEILLRHLNQYTKLMMLLRQLDWFEKLPFEDIPKNSRVVVYAAGKFGQNLYRHLSRTEGIQVVDWLDQSFEMYQEIGYEVHDPENFDFAADNYDYVVVAMTEKPMIDAVVQYLEQRGTEKCRIRRLTDEFMSEDYGILGRMLSVAICGFRKQGRALYERLIQRGVHVPYIMERNYQALSETEHLPIPIVGFNADIYEQADVIILTSDLPEELVRECIELAGITVPVISWDKIEGTWL